MVRRIHTAGGNTGYRQQLDRARRFLDKVAHQYDDSTEMDDVEFQDMMWSFFQHCWHVKDWIRNDLLVPQGQKDAAEGMAYQSAPLKICQDLCNGTKHLRLDRPQSGAGAQHHHVNTTIVPGEGRFDMDCLIDDGHGNIVSGKQLARDCIAEWERILQTHGLETARRS